MKTVMKKACGIAVSILCTPLAPPVIAYYSLYLFSLKKAQNGSDRPDRKDKTNKAKIILSLLSHLIAISALNAPLAVAIFTKAKSKLVSHIFATYVTLAFIAACELGMLKHPSLIRSR
jgi:hypothetical protein